MVIYKAEFPNGKVYIGKTINFEMRKYHHIWNSKRKEHAHIVMSKAIRKYGVDNIKWEIIYECSSLDEMNQKEKEFINFYKSTEHKYGYNMVCGDKEEFIMRENFDENYRIDIIKRKLKSNGHDPEKYVIITDELKTEIIKDYVDNKFSIKALSRKFLVSNQRLTRLLKSENIEIVKDRCVETNSLRIDDDAMKFIIDGYKSGKTIKLMAEELDLTIFIVIIILHDSGLRESKRFKNGKRYDGKQPKKRKLNDPIG